MKIAATKGSLIKLFFVAIPVVFFMVFFLCPVLSLLTKGFVDGQGRYTIHNFTLYFQSGNIVTSFINTMQVSVAAGVIAVFLAFLYSYGLTRTALPCKSLFYFLAMLPLFTPTMMHAIGLVFVAGNKGYIVHFLREITGWEIKPIYGFWGILFSEIIYTFPQAVTILSLSLKRGDQRLYDVADSMGASWWRKFIRITLPGVKYGLITSLLSAFILVFTDFGAPKIIGGNYAVLSTDIYKQVIGQQNFNQGAVIGIILLIPAVLAFSLEKLVQKKSCDEISTKSAAIKIRKSGRRDILFLVGMIIIIAPLLLVLGSVLYVSFVKVWPYNLTFTLEHYMFGTVAGGNVRPLFNSVILSLVTSFIGVLIIYSTAYICEKWKSLRVTGKILYVCANVPLAIPGMVIGLGYIFFFNPASFSLPGLGRIPNIFSGLYGSLFLLTMANCIHFFSVPFISATDSLKKMSNEYDLVARSLGVPFHRMLTKVVVPLSLRVFPEIVSYLFVNSMVTISALVFLYTPAYKPASIAIINMDDAGDTVSAAAMSILVLLINILFRIVISLVNRRINKKYKAWQI